MINPKILCKNHLLGEHFEIHKFRHNFVKKHKMDGRAGQIEPSKMENRHDILVREMNRRGYNHKSPYTMPSVDHLKPMKVDKVDSFFELISRCDDCYERFLGVYSR